MTDDRTLLELAARAAGFDVWFREHAKPTDILWCNRNLPDHDWVIWNPLINSGDALELAVKMGFNISADYRGMSIVRVIDPTNNSVDVSECWIHDNGADPYAATRRAIVRAAAAIGEAKP